MRKRELGERQRKRRHQFYSVRIWHVPLTNHEFLKVLGMICKCVILELVVHSLCPLHAKYEIERARERERERERERVREKREIEGERGGEGEVRGVFGILCAFQFSAKTARTADRPT